MSYPARNMSQDLQVMSTQDLAHIAKGQGTPHQGG
jgi:hypothetical protein